MLTLRPVLAYNLQMDWSLNPEEEIKNGPEEIKSEPEEIKIELEEIKSKPTDEVKSEPAKEIKTELRDIKSGPDEIKTELEEIKTEVDEIKTELEEIKTELDEIKNEPDNISNIPATNTEEAVTKHFEESLWRLAQLQKVPLTANGYHPHSRRNAFVPYARFNNNLDIKPPKPQPPAQHKSNFQQYGGNNTLGPSCSFSSTTAHSKEHPAMVTTMTPESYDVESISKILKTFQFNRFINSSIIQQEIKEEPLNSPNSNGGGNFYQKHSPSDRLGIGISSSSFGIWQTKIKQESPLVTISTDVDIEAELPCTSIKQRPPPKRKPVKPRKNIATPQENSSRVVKQNSKRSTKRKTNYCEASSDDEPSIIMHSKNRCTSQAVRTDLQALLPVIEDEVKVKQMVVKEESVYIKPELDFEIKKESNLETKTEVNSGTQSDDMAIKSEIYLELQTEVISVQIKTETTIEDIKIEVKDEPMSEEYNPADINGDSSSTAKRVRNPAAVAAAARNRNKLHPLTRKEQIMMNKLMKSKEPFLQNLPCLKLASRISKCRECRCSSLRSDSVFCRFYDFRRLRFKENAILVVDGFSDPNKDPGPNDISLWMPGPPPRDIDLDVSRFILMHVGDQFCQIWHEEQSAIKEHMSLNPTIAWKKVVKGVREICDVCETTLFNFHWTCSKCGFGVCIDCYKDRKRKKTKKIEKPIRGFDDYGWLVCTFRENHEQTNLMLTQIIPGNSLNFLAHRLHEVCKLWKIPQKCGCILSMGIQEDLFMPQFVEISNKIIKDAYLRFYSRECEIKYHDKIKGLNPKDTYDSIMIMEAENELLEEAKVAGTLPNILATTLKHLNGTPWPDYNVNSENTDHLQDVVTIEYHTLKTRPRTQRYLPQKMMTSQTSRLMFPGIEHDWLCYGKLLRLLNSRNYRNALIFQEVWKRGQPVMVSELCNFLNINLWHPEAFCRDFGEKKNDLINCMTGNLVPNQPMKHFWEGFQCVSKRLLDAEGEPMLLKLKDWPPGDDFAEILPTRFADLMSALPLPEYTLRTGSLNIASRLPNIFVPPDLGPKMYNAYGSALHPDKGTTNLHLDISDAVNIMVYVGIPTDASAKEQIKAAMRAIDSGGCDIMTRRRAREAGVLPGALWHIYSARDADKIRDLLNRVTIERGYRLEPDHDPIHDQNWYLDNELRERLYDDYGVEGYPIVQCLGDAVFIPAGAPHQVRNLHNCIKVAEDFVSPENIEHCFHLSQQFRKLSMSHTNHEDKLQIRNVIYHAVKDTASYLTYLLNRHL